MIQQRWVIQQQWTIEQREPEGPLLFRRLEGISFIEEWHRSGILTGRSSIERNGLGGASAGRVGIVGASLNSATLMERIMATATEMGTVGQGRAQEGRESGQNRTLHACDDSNRQGQSSVDLFPLFDFPC